MKFAILEGARLESQPGRTAECPVCRKAVIAKCGRHRVWHWAHRGVRACDPWWESETEWHRDWKNQFPKHWQEIVHTSHTREKHIADVKTDTETVLEFQHSFLHPEERASREAFYPKLVWVVDGRRRARDMAQFLSCLRTPIAVSDFQIFPALSSEGGALLRDWGASRATVYFDFRDRSEGNGKTLWRLNSSRKPGRTYLTPISQPFFLRVHLEGVGFEDAFTIATRDIEATLDELQEARQLEPLRGFERYLAQKRRARRRF